MQTQVKCQLSYFYTSFKVPTAPIHALHALHKTGEQNAVTFQREGTQLSFVKLNSQEVLFTINTAILFSLSDQCIVLRWVHLLDTSNALHCQSVGRISCITTSRGSDGPEVFSRAF